MSADLRLNALNHWVTTHAAGRAFTLSPASADASFRRYFRLEYADNHATQIVMDAPPDKEDCAPFVHASDVFAAAGLHVPALLAQDLQQGFLLLEDLGHTTFLDALQRDATTTPDALYGAAIGALVKLQCASQASVFPDYDAALLMRELQLFPAWYLRVHLGIDIDAALTQSLETVFARIVANNLAQARVFVHRDYHSRNLMVCTPLPGVIDFQDAVYGPITYDLVSLLRDAYIQWPEARVLDWCIRFWEQARAAGLPVPTDFACFHQDFEWMGLQRHLKVLGIFARLAHRDGKTRYLDDIPMVLSYARTVAKRYRDLHPLVAVLDRAAGQPTPRVGLSF